VCGPTGDIKYGTGAEIDSGVNHHANQITGAKLERVLPAVLRFISRYSLSPIESFNLDPVNRFVIFIHHITGNF
jgi:hypothetical protein